ncbi:MAG: hypothetical protein MUC62_07395 [Candidatus Thermoplasmatota archaeon]|jgi:tRNA wybutosine-synthesizing protein 2|nr:hypothetical protein [Candidatus Thermoplasmatota archaeon]
MTLRTSKAQAEAARRTMLELDLFDRERSIGHSEGVCFPVRASSMDELQRCAERLKEEGVTFELIPDIGLTSGRRRRRSPLGEVQRRLAFDLGPGMLDILPRKYERVGDALVLVMDPALEGVKVEVAEAYSKVLGARFVLRDRGNISGELREPDMEVLIPPDDGDFSTVHRENGVLYVLDPRFLMFSSGNVGERGRAGRLLTEGPFTPRAVRCRELGEPFEGEVVCDMFAGVGYFTLPLALSSMLKRVISIEKNLLAYGYLVEGVSLNRVTDRVAAVLGDNRCSAPEGVADRIIMGYVSGTVRYLEMAFRCASPFGAVIHLHDTVEKEVGAKGLFRAASEIAGTFDLHLELKASRQVKSYAPCVDHVALDIVATPQFHT